jgi:hypothetical protein
MNATEARQFGRYSAANASTVEGALRCGCKAYADIFTYNRWKALGYQVQRGQHAVTLPLVKVVSTEDDDGNDDTRKLLTRSAVFCRHQVDDTKAKAPAPAATPTPEPKPLPSRNPSIPPPPMPPPPAPQPTKLGGNVERLMAQWKEV